MSLKGELWELKFWESGKKQHVSRICFKNIKYIGFYTTGVKSGSSYSHGQLLQLSVEVLGEMQEDVGERLLIEREVWACCTVQDSGHMLHQVRQLERHKRTVWDVLWNHKAMLAEKMFWNNADVCLAYPARSVVNKDAADVLTFILDSSSYRCLDVAKENTIREFSALYQRKLLHNYDSTSMVNSQLVMEDSREVGVDFYLAGKKESPEYGRGHVREPVVNIHGVKSDQLLGGILLERSGELSERQVDHGLHQCGAPHAVQVLLEEVSRYRQQNSGDGV